MSQQINKVLQKVFPEEHRWKMELLGGWSTIAGNLIDKVRIERIQNDLLVLGVSHPAWAQELFFLSGVLKDKINKFLGGEKIKAIRFQTVDLSIKKNKCVPTKQKFSKKESHVSIKKKPVLNNIKNKELRDALALYYDRCEHIGSGERV